MPAPRRRGGANEALRKILAVHLPGGAAEVEIVAGEHGKPRLARDELEFNLSHSGEIALVAVSAKHPVGVDVERVQADRDPVALAERALGPEGVRAVHEAGAAARDLVFHRLWARHEARLKCLGVGVFRPSLLETDDLAVQDLEVAPGYAAAVAVAAAEVPPLRRWTFGPEALQKDSKWVS